MLQLRGSYRWNPIDEQQLSRDDDPEPYEVLLSQACLWDPATGRLVLVDSVAVSRRHH